MAEGWSPHAHTHDPITSHAAADELDPTKDVLLIVRFFADHDRGQGWTRFELRETTQLADVVARDEPLRRLSDAEARGFVGEMMGDSSLITRTSPFNRQQRAMRITEAGRAWLAGGASAVSTSAPKRRRTQPVILTDLERDVMDRMSGSDSLWLALAPDEVETLLALLTRLGVASTT